MILRSTRYDTIGEILVCADVHLEHKLQTFNTEVCAGYFRIRVNTRSPSHLWVRKRGCPRKHRSRVKRSLALAKTRDTGTTLSFARRTIERDVGAGSWGRVTRREREPKGVSHRFNVGVTVPLYLPITNHLVRTARCTCGQLGLGTTPTGN